MATVQKTPPMVATFFIGGAADKNKFWGVIPATNLIKNQLVSRYLDEINQTPLGSREINKSQQASYYGYEEMDDIFKAILSLQKTYPEIEIRLVGHSLGGWIAANLSEKINQAGINNSLLITIDPVGVGYFNGYNTPILTLPRPGAKIWINILANHSRGYSADDLVADLGMRYRPALDAALKSKPRFDYSAPFSHAASLEMVLFPGADGRSAWSYLFKDAP